MHFTTKHTKDSEIDIFEFLNFMLFVTSFENLAGGGVTLHQP